MSAPSLFCRTLSERLGLRLELPCCVPRRREGAEGLSNGDTSWRSLGAGRGLFLKEGLAALGQGLASQHQNPS